MGLMEYIFLTFFIVIVIIVLMFFLMGYQISQFSLDKQSSLSDQALSLTKQVSASLFLVKEDSVFDDGKLTSLATMPDACQRLEELFGKGWFFDLTAFDGSGQVACSQNTYPNCNHWSFCQKDQNSMSFDLPVNIYRNIGTVLPSGIVPKTDIGLLKVGIYVE